jgi:serine phosphatase RsbU (regulator of sigma subunit)
MAAEIEAKKRRRDEMQAAAQIQHSILPGPLAREGAAATVDLHAEMHAAREIGGDFYDYFLVGENQLAVTVADVSGKGIPAALRSTDVDDDLGESMERANTLLATENEASMFVTAFHGLLDLATGVLRYCNAGHNPPYLLRAGGGRETLPATGIAFGVMADMPYRVAETTLAAGDTLFLFSDGITEAFNPQAEEFGNARLEAALEAVRGRGAAEVVADILAATTAFAAGAEQSDDITALALVYRP